MEAISLTPPATVGSLGDDALERTLRRGTRERLFQSIVMDIDRAVSHFGADLIDEGTLLGVLRDRLAALEQLAQGQAASEGCRCSC